MRSGLLKGLAITVGGGLAFAIGLAFGKAPASARRRGVQSTLPDGAGGGPEPLVRRMDGIETRLTHLEHRAVSVSPSSELVARTIAPLEASLAANVKDVAALRTEVQTIEQRSCERSAALNESFETIDARITRQIESSVAVSLHEMELRLHREFQDAHARTLEAIVQTVERTVLQRISNLEQTLGEQSRAIRAIEDKAAQTDANLLKLLEVAGKITSTAGNPETARPAADVVEPPNGSDLYSQAKRQAEQWRRARAPNRKEPLRVMRSAIHSQIAASLPFGLA